MANQINAQPLPLVPDQYGVSLAMASPRHALEYCCVLVQIHVRNVTLKALLLICSCYSRSYDSLVGSARYWRTPIRLCQAVTSCNHNAISQRLQVSKCLRLVGRLRLLSKVHLCEVLQCD